MDRRTSIKRSSLPTATVQLAMISYETGSEVAWDASGNTISGNGEAKKWLGRPYRQAYIRPTY